MNVGLLLEMAAEGQGDRVAFGSRRDGVTLSGLLERAHRTAADLTESGAERLAFLDVNSEALPVAFFGASLAGVPFVPLNYRLPEDRLRRLVERTAPCRLVVGATYAAQVDGITGVDAISPDQLQAAARVTAQGGAEVPFVDPDDVSVLLYTSGTTGEPKAAMLRHRHLASYVMSSVEFAGASEDDAVLVSVPPYHIAGIAAMLSSVYAGRRVVYLPQFDAKQWVVTALDEMVTHTMVVPTMLGRILDALEESGEHLPSLRHLSYGGGRMPLSVVERALTALPHTDLVNAYGLTETSSTIAVLTPDDHREAMASDDPMVHARLGSVGRVIPSLEVEIRGPSGAPVPLGERGEICVRGEQVSGEYVGRRSAVTADGWLHTNDGGWFDADGYLYVEGRLDDVIVRGGENLSPGELEDVLLNHPAVVEVAVVGVPDDEWGQTVAAFVVLAQEGACSTSELQDWVRARLRSTYVPSRVEFCHELPYNETGKLLRRVLRERLSPA